MIGTRGWKVATALAIVLATAPGRAQDAAPDLVIRGGTI